MQIPILRNETTVYSFKADESTVYSYQLMGEHRIVATITTFEPLPVQIGDYINYKGHKYYINKVPNVQASDKLVYTVTFESEIYRLHDKILLDEGNMNFTYFGDAQLYMELIRDNINEIDPGWTIGTVEPTAEKHIPFEGKTTCRDALTIVAEAFKLEWYNVGKVLHMVKQVGNVTTHTFRYGQHKGLYSLTRSHVEEKNIVTKVYGFGSDKNLPEGYRNGATQLIFNDKFLTMNTNIYGIKEGTYEDKDIYPHRDGTVSEVTAFTEGQATFSFKDASLDFNINDHLLEGAVAKAVFKTGELAGYEFEITKYDHSTKTITCKVFTEASNYIIPNGTFKAAVGDVYTLVDISMPESYITAAEVELQAKTLEYLQENSVPRVAYDLELDPLHAKTENISLNPGDKVTVIDERLGVNAQVRVNSVSYPVTFPDVLVNGKTFFTAEIADFITYTRLERIQADTRDNIKDIKIVDRTNAERARRNTARFRELQDLVFDPDGYFDAQKIKPLSIETLMLSVGAKSQNFTLNNVLISPNYNGNANTFAISAGQLIHREIEVPTLGYIWDISGFEVSGLDPLKPYYVYARCSKTALAGTWVVSENQIPVEQETGYYHFLLGVLYKVKDGLREFDPTNGISTITGDRITAGRIQDITKQNFFDLISGAFKLGNDEYGIDWNVTEEGRLTIRGFVIANDVQVGSDGIINAGISGLTPDGLDSIMIWAGGTKETATFKVNQKGEIYATAGYIGGFSINQSSMQTAGTDDDDPRFVLYPNGSNGFMAFLDTANGKWAGIGANVLPSTAGSEAVARFENTKSDNSLGTRNYALYLKAEGAEQNIALQIAGGDFRFDGSDIRLGNEKGITTTTMAFMCGQGTYPGASGYLPVTIGAGESTWLYFKYVNGICVGHVGQ